MTANFQRLEGLAGGIADSEFRASYMAHSLRAFLADQIRALRGERSQRVFGEAIGKPQSVVSRLESEDYGKVTLQTLLDIANKLDIALLVRYVDFPTFLRSTADFSPNAVAPRPFSADAFVEMMREEARPDETSAALRAFLSASFEQNFTSAVQSAANTLKSPTNNPSSFAIPSSPDLPSEGAVEANTSNKWRMWRTDTSSNAIGALENVA
jgi:hypothetical protein